MSVHPGDRIGPYEVLRPLGAGGMGEVYQARDNRLKRDVALKVLPDSHRFDAHRLARFEREAQVLAALNHPHIATLYGVEPMVGGQALVMELVEGDTLTAVIARAGGGRREGGLPRAQALRIASQIADALEAAHERGIVHRDLKPSNVNVRADGSVKVLDFGLARMWLDHSDGDPHAETLTSAGDPGVVLGTPAYMSPEQARGERVDRRTDVWAFGCVLYEMLTGQPAFGGATRSDVLARVLEREPAFDALPPDTPPSIRRLLQRTLAKDVRDRLRDIGDVGLELKDALTDVPPSSPRRAFRVGAPTALATALAAAIAVALAVASWNSGRRPDAVASRVSRFELRLPASAPLRDGGDDTRLFALSPDGTLLVYLTTKGLAMRRLDRLQVDVLEVQGFETRPFFSPDGKWIAGTGDGLRKISVAGGPLIQLTDTGPGAVGTWGDDGIVFADVTGLFRVSPDGGMPERLPVGALGPNEQVTFPEPLPGGSAVLFTVISTRSNTLGDSSTSATARIEALDLASGVRTVVLRGAGRPRYLATGHLVYASGESLFVVPFDRDRLATTGDPVQLAEGSSEFAVSDDGVLVYAAGLDRTRRQLVWVDRHGREESLGAPTAQYAYPRLSPDGARVALDVLGPNRDVWIWDIRRRALDRFTTDPTENALPAWTRDGARVAFASGQSGVPNMFMQSADGAGAAEPLVTSARFQQPMSFATDGRLIFTEVVPNHGRDLMALSLDGSRSVEALVQTPANEFGGEVSPDGRWIAYVADESGQLEVYVRPYPRTTAGRWIVSTSGGRQPVWTRDGRELLYRDFGGAVIAVPVGAGRSFVSGGAVTVIPASRTYSGFGSAIGGRTFDVSLDGSRFLMIKELDAGDGPSFVVVQNWLTEVRERLRPR
jgi:serine/threonine protein kinase/Tol biopolymer transport system component